MDPRRLLILSFTGLGLCGCAGLRDALPVAPAAAGTVVVAGPTAPHAPAVLAAPGIDASEAARPDPVGDTAVPCLATTASAPAATRATGRRAIGAADADARTASAADSVVGEVRVFAWSPGRVYEVRTAPLRVTTLTLGAGETLVSKAAGDTVRWQIGETTSGEGAGQRSHVLIKPLQRGLETNLVLTTNRRVVLLDLKSGGVDGFNAAVAWDLGGLDAGPAIAAVRPEETRAPDPVATPEGVIDARYAVEPQGRRPRWTPASVFDDGLRTFIAFGADLEIDEAPALFVLAADGEAQMVNYRQSGGLFIVDRVFDRAELRLGGRRPQVVRIRRLQGAAR